MVPGFFTANAVLRGNTITMDAWLTGGRNLHDRTLDHSGVEDDTTMVVAADFGRYRAGMTIHDVLVDMTNRIISLEDTNKGINQFTANAFIAWYITSDAVLQGSGSSTFTMDSELVNGGSFTADSTIIASNEFTITAGGFLV